MPQKTASANRDKAGKAVLIPESVTITEVSVAVVPQTASEVAEHEKWLSENPEARALIERGLADIAAGRVHRMSFAEYADTVIED